MFVAHLRSLVVITEKIVSPVIFQTKYKSAMSKTYEVGPPQEAVNCINTLQSNISYIENAASKGVMSYSAIRSTTIAETQKYLLRTGITLEQLDKLSVIHVAGTKGKGSTCAFCESIIRQYGYKTGFYSSPHLIAVRERIKLNGTPLSKQVFADNVFRIYNKLMDNRDHEHDMPAYFRFLTILAYNIFIAKKVDVAIIEVGIGGEYDCTNVVRNTPIVGITTLGIDHVSMLGDSLEQIAWQKAGIMKKQSKVFTVSQSDAAVKVLQERSIERNVRSFEVVPNFNNYNWNNIQPKLGINGAVQKTNASLAIQLAHNWIQFCGTDNGINVLNDNLTIPNRTKLGLECCKWPGRHQIFKTSSHTFYLDGAHTSDSLEICARWFQSETLNYKYKALIFNATGDRNSEELLQKLTVLSLNRIMFVPNTASSVIIADQANLINTDDHQMKRCQIHKNTWLKLQSDNNSFGRNVSVFTSVENAIQSLPNNIEYKILVTGSLHLVGAALTILDPELKTF